MKRSCKSIPGIVLQTLLLLQGPGIESAAVETMVLLTVEEGAMTDASPGLIDAGSSMDTGPSIEVIQPELNAVLRSPIPINVRFVSNGKNVDLSKLKVEVLKILTIDITKRVLPYATCDGIHVDKATLPRGEHKLRITIGDEDGGVSQKIFQVKIL